MKAQFYNAWIGGSSGVFKGVCALEKCKIIVKNMDSLKSATNKNPVTAMNWSDDSEEEILIGYASQLVKVFNIKTQSFTSTHDLRSGDGPIIGLCKYNGVLITAIDSGVVKVWNDGASLSFQAGSHLEKMRQNPIDRCTVATGGRENDLKLWDLQTGNQIFTAKNVRHDNLEMRVPVWVTDMCFLPETRKVAVTTRHGHVRLYDPSTNTRRPVVNVTIPEQCLTSLSTSIKDHHVIVGSGSGQMNLVDLRSKGLVMQKYKGFTGSIKSIACPEENPFIVSVSLDRHFRIHNLHTKELLFKEYVQSKLTCVLIRKDFNLSYPKDFSDEESMTTFAAESNETISASKDHDSSSDEYEEMFKNMPTVGDKRPKISNTSRKKHKA